MSGHQSAQDDQVECCFDVGFDDLGLDDFTQVVAALPLFHHQETLQDMQT